MEEGRSGGGRQWQVNALLHCSRTPRSQLSECSGGILLPSFAEWFRHKTLDQDSLVAEARDDFFEEFVNARRRIYDGDDGRGLGGGASPRMDAIVRWE